MLQQLGFEHCHGVDRFSSRAFSMVMVSEQASDVFGIDSTCFVFTLSMIY